MAFQKDFPVADLRLNPNNPRVIKDAKYEQLKRSISSSPEFLEARPIVVNPDYVVLGGNQRLKVVRELGMKSVPVYVATWDEVKQREFIVKDNVSFGSWDWELLTDEWEVQELTDWGMDLEEIVESTGAELQFDPETGQVTEVEKDSNSYTHKIPTPVYEPTGERPKLEKLANYEKYEALKERVLQAEVPEDMRAFLLAAAGRFVRFDYQNIAEYYAHADKDTQELFEDLALVIIDFDKAIENGFVQLGQELLELYEQSNEG